MKVEEIIISIGGSIVKSIIKMWVGDNNQLENVSDTIIDIFTRNKIDIYEARHLSRSFESIGDKIAANFTGIFEESNLESNSKIAISKEISNVINNFKITQKFLLGISNNPKVLYNMLLESNSNYKKYFNDKEKALYERGLDLSSQYIIDIAPNLPNYTKENFHEIIRRFDNISQKIDNLVDKVKLISVSSSIRTEQDFERDYKNSIIRKYNKINLFGANSIDRNMRIYDLSIAYVDLEVSKCNEEQDNEYRISISDVFNDNNIIFIKGEAGSGKTTLLQWLAVKSANGEIDEKIQVLRNAIPIVIELRKIKEWPINLDQYISMMIKDVVSKIPDNWIGNILKSGNALLLIDGLDEISKTERENVLLWIEELTECYDLKVMITLRPSVKEKLIGSYTEIEILPMSQINIEKFIDYWHNAVLIQQGLEDIENVKIIKEKLLDRINYNEPINKLATNPLLCAMLCALHYKNNLVLPSDRNELYEECCKMMLDSRDSAREIKSSDIGELNYREKRAILDDLAYWMIRNGQVSIRIDELEDRVLKKARNMNIIESELESGKLLKYLIERSGVIREPEVGIVDFIHKTFQEYMAAKDASNQGDWGLLVENSGKESWYETIILATSFASQKNANFLIEGLLKKAETEKINNIGYKLIAMACTESALEVSKSIRDKIENITKELIPPNINQCKEIALSGNLAIPYLVYKDNYSESEQVSCLRTLRIIGSKRILPIVSTYVNKNISEVTWTEIERLLYASNQNDIARCELGDSIIKYIIGRVKDNKLEVNHTLLTSISKVKDVREQFEVLDSLSSLRLYNFNGKMYSYMSFIKNVKELYIMGIFNDIDFLKSMKNLELLSILNNDGSFDVYKLNEYANLKTLKSLTILIHNGFYLNFNEFDNFKGIEELNIRFKGNSTEVLLYELKDYKKLKKLKLEGEMINYMDLSDLKEIDSLEELELDCFGKLIDGIIVDLAEISNLKKLTLNILDQDSIDSDMEIGLKCIFNDCDIKYNYSYKAK